MPLQASPLQPAAPSSRPPSVWQQGHLTFLLALIAGYVDVFGFLTSRFYVSFMSGNTTQGGLQLGQGHLATAWASLIPVVSFVAGVFAGTLLLHSRLHRPPRWLFLTVAALLLGSLGAGQLQLSRGPHWPDVVLLAVAMGAMNTSVNQVGAQPVSLGYVTGSLNNLAQHAALALRRQPVPGAQGAWDTHRRRISLLSSVWGSFLTGVVLGAAAIPQLAAWTLLAPAALLTVLALVADRQGEKP